MSGLVQLPTGTKKGNGLMEKQSSTVQVGSTAGADPDAYSSDITDLIKFVEYIKEVDLTNVEPLESLSMDCHVELHEAECDIDQQFSSHSVEEEVAGTALMDMLTENSKSKREGNYFVVET
ncbi:hypothetical protein AX774_g2581 [Zancudomyces culisetae]|uniref:Uncharacterized protein n=1 Tax=Zancudomyces culisetae TaxID=1213189 RepID=A0A1R1PSH7_ZANCU|nr:hypothetical protein AX774_g2581 [Zancudomyces culisetae]|eukprot:OMH83901.1 hypothetical protein AX774_g2581 [Zancudomyces culisetae]